MAHRGRVHGRFRPRATQAEIFEPWPRTPSEGAAAFFVSRSRLRPPGTRTGNGVIASQVPHRPEPVADITDRVVRNDQRSWRVPMLASVLETSWLGEVEVPCRLQPDLFFAEAPADVETAKAVCGESRSSAWRMPWSVESHGVSGEGSCSSPERSWRAS